MAKQIELFNKLTCTEFSNACLKALQVVAKEYGVNIEKRGGKYNNSDLTMKFEATVQSAKGVEAKKETAKADWDAYVEMDPDMGLKPDDFGKTFTVPGRPTKYTIIEYNPRKSKNPVVTQGSDGKRWVWPPAVVKRHLQSK
jgi:hypothetical protein